MPFAQDCVSLDQAFFKGGLGRPVGEVRAFGPDERIEQVHGFLAGVNPKVKIQVDLKFKTEWELS